MTNSYAAPAEPCLPNAQHPACARRHACEWMAAKKESYFVRVARMQAASIFRAEAKSYIPFQASNCAANAPIR